MNRTHKAGLVGFGFLFSLGILSLIFKIFWFLGVLMLPWFFLVLGLYFLGYTAPALGRRGIKLHQQSEAWIRSVLDWLDFHAPVWAWSTIARIRVCLDWLGLHVKHG